MTLNLDQRSFKVIDFGTNRKRVYTYSYRWSMHGNLDTLAPFERYIGLNVENRHFPYPTPLPAKIRGRSVWKLE